MAGSIPLAGLREPYCFLDDTNKSMGFAGGISHLQLVETKQVGNEKVGARAKKCSAAGFGNWMHCCVICRL